MKVAARAAFALLIALEALALILFPNVTSDFTWVGLIVTAAFAWAVMESFRLSASLYWIALTAIGLDAVSALLQLYSRIDPWDIFMHLLGGSIIAAGALELVLRGLKKEHIAARREGPFIAAAVYMLTATIGFSYEFWEYLVDHFQYGYPKSLVSAYDSIEDQLANLAGATLVLLAYYFWQKRAKAKEPASL